MPRTHFKTLFVAKRWIFERDKEDEQKTVRRSRSYVERFFVKSDEVVAKKPALQQKGVLK